MPEQVRDDSGREIPIGVPGTVVFNRMRDDHRRASRSYRQVAIGAAALGLCLLVSGLFLVGTPGLWLVALGAMLVACAAFPYNESLERAERADGLEVLREEWVAAGPDAAVADRRGSIIDLIFHLYAPK